MSNLIVLKFGSSVLRSADDLPGVVHEIYRYYREGRQVLAVVSAIGRTTEDLLRLAKDLSSNPEPWATAELLATGERTSAALLGIALDRIGVPARVVNPREIGLEIAGSPMDGEPVAVDTSHVHELLRESPVLVVPGFFGTSREGRTQLLGRGGSDFTAVFLAAALNARCRLLKDVDGVYESDPANLMAHPNRYEALNYEDALRVAGKLIQPKAVEYLRAHRASCEVAAPAFGYCTKVHAGSTRIAAPARTQVQRIIILGLGTVGFGVYQRLCADPGRYRVIGALVRDRAKHAAAGVPAGILHTNSESLAELEPSLVIDALPGYESSYSLLKHYLGAGIDVISANKAVIAAYGKELSALAAKTGAKLRYSAAVGGGTPMIEVIDRIAGRAKITRFEAVLNGTCNFLLGACASGMQLREAIIAAQRLGFAEADPIEDLSGEDAARKLRILLRHAFGTDVPINFVQPFDASVAEAARNLFGSGQRLRQIASVSRTRGKLSASVEFKPVGPDSPFYLLADEANALQVTLDDGSTESLNGRGAGRWATTEAVIADVLELARSHASRSSTSGLITPKRAGMWA
jgi:homoserine dehydrogenase